MNKIPCSKAIYVVDGWYYELEWEGDPDFDDDDGGGIW